MQRGATPVHKTPRPPFPRLQIRAVAGSLPRFLQHVSPGDGTVRWVRWQPWGFFGGNVLGVNCDGA